MRQRLMVVALVLVGLAVPTTAGAARAPDLVCGQTITTSVKLRADLTCSGDGLIVAAHGVTVNLAGHTITSTEGVGAGIRVAVVDASGRSLCAAGVEVSGGTVSGFAAGIAADGCWEDPVRVSGMALTGNAWGVEKPGISQITIDRSTIVGPNGIGRPYTGGPLYIGGASVTRSSIQVTSPTGYSLLGSFAGTTYDASRLEGGRILVIGGRISIDESRLRDVAVYCDDGQLDVSNTRVTGGGLAGSLCGYAVTANHFVGLGSGTAMDVRGSYFLTQITDNRFTGWDTGVSVDGIPQGRFAPATITGNAFRRNRVGVSADGYGTVSANSFLDNTGTGLLVLGGFWHVGSNSALRNGGLGIDAQGPWLNLIDDGGNIARRNLPPQCIGVVCTPH
jgi:hypothetical protein